MKRKHLFGLLLFTVTVFTTSGNECIDADGNTYRTVTIGNHIWMAENLRTTTYQNGDAIPLVKNNHDWTELNTGARCVVANNSKKQAEMLYNWHAATDSRNIAPKGWHVPTDSEWRELAAFFKDDAGGKLKQSGLTNWNSPNTGASNESGFNAVATGVRYGYDGSFGALGVLSNFWSCTAFGETSSAWDFRIAYDNAGTHRANIDKRYGFAIRCVKDVETAPKKPTEYVNPLIDTHKSRWFFFASAARPFGMVSLSPDTWPIGDWKAGYLYDSLHVRCFSHVHEWQLSGIPVMPTVGAFKGHQGMEAYKSSFSHADEIVKPGYHSVFLKDYNIRAELTSTCRVGFHRYQFPNDSAKSVIFDIGAILGHGSIDNAMVEKISDYEIAGYSLLSSNIRRSKPTYVYFVARFNQPIIASGSWEKGILSDKNLTKREGKNIGVYVRFKASANNTLLMKVAISYTGIEQARTNMNMELNHWDFDKVVAQSNEEWNSYLTRITVKGGTEKQKVKFYTDLWHALLGRKIISDVDGSYCDMTGEKPIVRQIEKNAQGIPNHQQYNFDAWWGSHWNLNVLWSMVYPEMMNEFCASMVEMYRYGGLIPRGPAGGNYSYVMIGDPASSFFATAYNKGIRNYDVQKAYEGLYKNAFPGGIRDRAGYETGNNPTGGGMLYYIERGYVPEGIEGPGMHRDGASMTLEYAYQDWCVGQLAKALGKTADYKMFNKRAQNYRKLWNPQTHFMHPRNKDGSWIKDFRPISEGFNSLGFCESNSAIYTNFVPHNVAGLINLFGGKEKYSTFVDSCFIKAKPNRFVAPHNNHAVSWVDYENQPSCQMAHLFNHSGAPWLTQKWVREVKDIAFSDVSPYGGYNGDEDQGQMGALGVLMAIGLFQMDGGAAVNSSYEITSPIFDRIEIQLNSKYYPGKKFIIQTKNNQPENKYIQQAELNGKNQTSFAFSHATFAKGGKLMLVLGNEPNKKWGIK